MAEYDSRYSGPEIDEKLGKTGTLETSVSGLLSRVNSLETSVARKQDRVSGKGLSTNDYTTAEKNKLSALYTKAQLDGYLNGKVDKVSGKGLSTNDYTNAEKSKLAALPTSEQIASSFAGKQDVIPDLSAIRANATKGATAYQKPTGGIPKSDLSLTVAESLGKADTAIQPVPGKGLSANDYTNADKSKLASLPTATQLSESLSEKQDAIADLETIRAGAQKGSTAYQKPTSGIPQADLSNEVKASLAKAESAVQPVSGKGLSTNDFSNAYRDKIDSLPNAATLDILLGRKQDIVPDLESIRANALLGSKAYQKPSGGIPLSDLSLDVRAALARISELDGKADKIPTGVAGNFMSIDAHGNIADSGHKHSDYSGGGGGGGGDLDDKADKVIGAIVGDIAILDKTGNLVDSGLKPTDLESKANRVTAISKRSTNDQYPTAKGMFDHLSQYVTIEEDVLVFNTD